MRITKIERQKKDPRRKNIYADGEFVLGLSDETLLKAGLRIGDEIGTDRLKSLLQDEETINAKRVALRFLAQRPRTTKEIRDKLRESEFSEMDVSKTIESLKQGGLINDIEFARMYVRDALALKAIGRNLLKRKLLLLGVDKRCVEQAIGEGFKDIDEHKTAMDAGRRFLQKSTATRKASDGIRLRNRLASFLGRRGFDWETVNIVMKELLKEDEE